MARFTFADWQAEQLRFTAFPMPAETIRRPDWWEEMVGAQPDEATVNPKKGSALVRGQFASGNLLLSLEPDRIDWIFGPAELTTAASPDFGSVGTAEEAIQVFSQFIERWLTAQAVPALARIAFGGVVIHEEVNKRAAYERLADYLPIRLPADSSDFMMQINLPPIKSRTGVEGLELNRLSRWVVMARRLVAFTLDRGASHISEQSPERCAIRLELDINTMPSFPGPIPPERTFEIFRELVTYGVELATRGVTS